MKDKATADNKLRTLNTEKLQLTQSQTKLTASIASLTKNPKATVSAAELTLYEKEYNNLLKRQGETTNKLVTGDVKATSSSLLVPPKTGSTTGKPSSTSIPKKPTPLVQKPTKPVDPVKAKVATEVVSKGLPIDQNKKDFAKSQALRTEQIQKDMGKSAANIVTYEKTVTEFPKQKKDM